MSRKTHAHQEMSRAHTKMFDNIKTIVAEILDIKELLKIMHQKSEEDRFSTTYAFSKSQQIRD